MIIKKNKGIWLYGISGSGKTLASKFFKKKLKNSFIFDGDKIRKYISFELGYSVRDRKIQLKRMFGLVKISKESKIFPIVSTVYMSQSLKKKLKKEKILLIKIHREILKIKNRKKIYSKNTKNVIGVDIKTPILKNEFIIQNNDTKNNFYKKLRRVIYAR
jgi:adenylylsulfate kinase-like enzyme|tara:strand:- start:41 stop:520 length:480 start_codon:yes stop_codon:yes gene_type:complete